MLTITYGCDKPEDINRLHELENLCFSRAFRWRKTDLIKALETGDTWLGVYNDKIVGYVLVEAEGSKGHIISLTVDPAYQRRGFGKALMEEAEAYYKKAGLKELWLEVQTDNPAQTLYFKLGYRVTGVKRKYYSDGSTAIIMVSQLKTFQ